VFRQRRLSRGALSDVVLAFEHLSATSGVEATTCRGSNTENGLFTADGCRGTAPASRRSVQRAAKTPFVQNTMVRRTTNATAGAYRHSTIETLVEFRG